MKKLIAFIFLGLSFTFLPLLKQNSDIFLLDNISRACFVTHSEVDDEDAIKTMQYNYVYAEKGEIKAKAEKIDFDGVILYFDDNDVQKLIDQLSLLVLKEESFDGYKVIYGHTNKFDDFVMVENKRVNAQIVLKNDQMLAGFPMVLSGF